MENGSHPVSAALDFLDEGSGSFCGDTYYLRYLDNRLYILYTTGHWRDGNTTPSLCSIDI